MSEVSEIQEKKTLWNLNKEHAQAKSKEATMSEKKTDEAQVRDELKEGAHEGVGSGSSYGLKTAERLKRIFALKSSAPRALLDSGELWYHGG